MRLLSKTTPSRPTLRSTSIQASLSLPEILETVFSYLDQETLRRCRLVSRQWLLVSSRFNTHVLVWDDNQN
ncbi:hypothetical protein BGZ52_003980, partial [Haplosporangium bisporale]